VMRLGGAGNVSFTARRRAHLNDHRAWAVNELRPLPWTLLCKPLLKIPQFRLRPPEAEKPRRWWKRTLADAV
jgi:glycosyltransferase